MKKELISSRTLYKEFLIYHTLGKHEALIFENIQFSNEQTEEELLINKWLNYIQDEIDLHNKSMIEKTKDKSTLDGIIKLTFDDLYLLEFEMIHYVKTLHKNHSSISITYKINKYSIST